MSTATTFQWGLGRRKSAVARVRVAPGQGGFLVNGKPIDQYFSTSQMQSDAKSPLALTENAQGYDVFCNVDGGGPVGQAGAVRMGLARALKAINPTLEGALRDNGHLTRDSRMKERKHYGLRGARRGTQFSKR
jgi:small subunit ribosomal protein S9